jgi:hypothetical protein
MTTKMKTNYKYIKNTIDGADIIFREPDKVWIPLSLENKDYQEYLKWLEAGNQPELEIKGEN